MAFHIRNPATDALARRVAALKKTGLTEAVHTALARELEREEGKPTLVEVGVAFCRELRAKGRPTQGKPADKAFRDALHEKTLPGSPEFRPAAAPPLKREGAMSI